MDVPSSVVCRMTGNLGAYEGLIFRNTGLHDFGAQADCVEVAIQRSFNLLTYVDIGDIRVGAPEAASCATAIGTRLPCLKSVLLPEATMMEKCCTPMVLPPSFSVMV